MHCAPSQKTFFGALVSKMLFCTSLFSPIPINSMCGFIWWKISHLLPSCLPPSLLRCRLFFLRTLWPPVLSSPHKACTSCDLLLFFINLLVSITSILASLIVVMHPSVKPSVSRMHLVPYNYLLGQVFGCQLQLYWWMIRSRWEGGKRDDKLENCTRRLHPDNV